MLHSPTGIIAESEGYAAQLFKTAHSFYSAEGSTLCIKAMLALACQGKKNPLILAGRNCHKSFIYAAALLDFKVCWLKAPQEEHIAVACVTPKSVADALHRLPEPPAAVYITSPDYLGNILDIKGIAEVCDSYGVPLLVDNAHGAYLAFLENSLHPIALGASMCTDSAHKTLPVLTGGAYLHISKKAECYLSSARRMLSLFASTSPSYLILASLDLCNAALASDFPQRLKNTTEEVNRVKYSLSEMGFAAEEGEPLKIVIRASKYGYEGEELMQILRDNSVIPEFYDREYIVLMASVENGACDFERILSVFSKISPRKPLIATPPKTECLDPVLSIREAIFADSETVPASLAEGRILCEPGVSCPPAIPIAISGERLTQASVRLFEYYGIKEVSVVKEN